MSADRYALSLPYQEFALSADVFSPRKWRLSDVDYQGNDLAPPEADYDSNVGQIDYWQGISALSGIQGSVSGGGWATTITVPAQGVGLADLQDFFGLDLMIRTWHGGVPGVVGAAGIDRGRVLLFRGHLRQRTSNDEMDYGDNVYEMRSSSSFLQDSSFSRSIDWFAGATSHSAPVSCATLIDHLLKFHTNWTPRNGYSVYLPNQIFNSFTMNEGAVYDMLKSVADNEVIEGWVYCTREDDLVISGHPNMVGAIYSNGASDLANPIIEFDDTIVMRWQIPTRTRYEIASYTVTAMTSNQQEITKIYYIPGGLGSRERAPVTLMSDDENHVGEMARRGALHFNRQFVGVKLHLPLNVAVNTGDIVLCTHRGKRLATTWTAKPFVVTDVEYSINLDSEQFTSIVTVDEVIMP